MPTAITLPPIERFTLPNGLQVIAVTNPKLPVVSVQLAIRAGRAEEPLARMGVAELTADVLLKGSKKRDALAIARTVDKVGASVTADASYEATWLTCSALARDLGTCLDVLPDVIVNPSFPAKELDLARENLLAGVARRLDDPNLLAGAHIQNLIWGNDHVRGWVTSAAWLRGLTRADVVAWHKTWFVPSNAILTVSGAIDVAKLKKDLPKAFGGWKAATVPPRPQYVDPRPRGPRVRLVDKPGAPQTFIRIGQLGIRHDDARFFPTLVWNYALGGGAFESRLMKVVRVDGGKTYGASSTFDRNIERGSFVARDVHADVGDHGHPRAGDRRAGQDGGRRADRGRGSRRRWPTSPAATACAWPGSTIWRRPSPAPRCTASARPTCPTSRCCCRG